MNTTAIIPVSADDPRVRPVAKEVATLTEQVETFEVTTAADFERGAEILKAIKAALNSTEEQRKEITQPLDASKKRVMDLFRPFTDSLAAAERKLKQRLVSWKNEQDRIAREEARKADEKARKDREKLEKQAADAEAAGRTERADALRDRAVSIVAAVPITEAPRVSGISTRKIYKFRIVDASKVPDQYKVIDEKRIGAVVRALKTDANIPGVEVYEETSLAAGAA